MNNLTSPRSPKYLSLDIWRGIACLLVVLLHSTYYANLDTAGGWIISLLKRGWIGVPLFFVASGYFIATTADSTRRKGTVGEYFWKRCRRIYPPYWACLILAVLFIGVGEYLRPGLFDDAHNRVSPPWHYGVWEWIGNVTLTEGWRAHLAGTRDAMIWPWFVGQAWTLGYEVQFYAIVGVLLIWPRQFFPLMAAVTVLSAAAWWMCRRYGVDVDGWFFSRLGWVQFAAGVGVYYAINYGGKAFRWALLAALVLAAAYFARGGHYLLRKPNHAYDNAMIAMAFAAALLALHPLDAKLAGSRLLRPFGFCGAICYSLYLVHWPICKATSHLLADAGITSSAATLLITVPVCVAVSIAAGWAFFWTVERRFLNTKPPAVAREPALVAV